MTRHITIDGTMGEGGGQVLRTSLVRFGPVAWGVSEEKTTIPPAFTGAGTAPVASWAR